ncbi:MAG TPA: tripartite tricarboxylate transporter substrate binding protein [Burkholderiales bacterium]|nr:tripartite tricarboxylate transporter substrate binding protein [Burkholderiales bacterium]
MIRIVPAIAAGALALASMAAPAQEYPYKPITLVVPFAAGSGTDSVARIVGQKLAERVKQQVLVEDKAGASAQIGAEYVAKAKPDGYTLFMATNTPFSANPSLFKRLRYDPIKDFTPILRVGELPFALVVSPKLPVNSTRELLDYAKANPGKISYATPNSTSLVASETIKHQAKLDIVGVQYKSSPQALTDLVGGQLEMYVVDLGSGLSTIKGGKVKTLAVTPARGTKILPGVPPLAATLPGFDLTSWNGIFGPADLPRPIVDKLNAEVLAVLAEKDVQEKLANVGFEVWPSKSPDEFAKYVGEQLALWTLLIKQAGIQPE